MAIVEQVREPQIGLATRRSLLSRLKNWGDNESWNEFFETYWRLIYSTAIRSGLGETEAEDVVQETVLSVAKSMPSFRYDPQKGSFKSWLLKLTSWRIMDHLRKRKKHLPHRDTEEPPDCEIKPVDEIPDETPPQLEAIWDHEWELNLMEAAVERVKKKVEPKHYQIFDLYVLRKWPVDRVSQTLKISRGKVYLVKHRINRLLKQEIELLRNKTF